MATDFDSNAIITTGGIKPSCVDTPGDMRTRVKELKDMEDIPLPYIGMIVYCEENDSYYKINALKEKEVGFNVIENAAVASWVPIPVLSLTELDQFATLDYVDRLYTSENQSIQNLYFNIVDTNTRITEYNNTLLTEIKSLKARIEELENPNINTDPKQKYIDFRDNDHFYQLNDYDSEIGIYKAWTFEMVYVHVATNCDNIHVNIKDEESHILEATLIDDFVSNENDQKIYLLRIKPKSDGVCTLKISNEDGSCETNVVLIYLEPNKVITHNITYDFEGISLVDLSEYNIDNKLIHSCTHGQHIILSKRCNVRSWQDVNENWMHEISVGNYGPNHCSGHIGIAFNHNYENYYFIERKLYINGYELDRCIQDGSIEIEAFGDVHIVYKIGNLDEL